VFGRSAGQRAVRLLETLPHLQRLFQQKGEKIAFKANGRILLVDPDDVVSVHAEGNYVLLQADACSHLLRVPISSIAKKLKPYGSCRFTGPSWSTLHLWKSFSRCLRAGTRFV
jgi:DNA-binding LytR/AlgR family response regulator